MNTSDLTEKLERSSDTYKGQNGKVLVIGGSKHFTGAPALIAEASLRTGADLVKILTSEEVRPLVQGFSPDYIVESFEEEFEEEDLEKASNLERWADVTVIGPGISAESSALKDFLENSGRTVVDAEAIAYGLYSQGNIFTPHKEEAESIIEGYGSISEFSSEKDNTVIVTGH